MDDVERARRQQSFGQAVDVYDRTRPLYDDAAVSWCLGRPAGPLVVCELGAGTGKLTRSLLRLGHEVLAVEPDEIMLGRLGDKIGSAPGLTARRGRAEAIPAEDASVDAVIAGQAWHWFDQGAVQSELSRVVKPGGVASAVWNTSDTRIDWVREWSRLTHGEMHSAGRQFLGDDVPGFGPSFMATRARVFKHQQTLAPTDLVDRAASSSRVFMLSPSEREHVLAGVRHLIWTHPDLADRDEVALPFLVECFRAHRL